ncbi:hypothetical protein SUGI_0967510 [Cryptomeria japonica]|nr:hypothetical protein SUGI_0967510 [Cryptomeria japonica]
MNFACYLHTVRKMDNEGNKGLHFSVDLDVNININDFKENGRRVQNLKDSARLFSAHSLFFLVGIDEKDGQQLIIVKRMGGKFDI